ncbi:YhcN/YlaJ family sporulation lipoprotein [Paenibacillus sp. JX-17]|uniref:YhcN/YlaJ family sporulation lipoprotein n=1 Tax=Paenibacillus lacisoli TaxID=3064525 RepID=A0ABT9CBS4_9BACL|nr:YhcN/YlaJ family sporulation lipoprotein [Paenibacillus sp. JX-17]MDO7905427.1 YhcN/YlaJ family sporulation lipoprotein [Paenibacillus sp. JX-17]
MHKRIGTAAAALLILAGCNTNAGNHTASNGHTSTRVETRSQDGITKLNTNQPDVDAATHLEMIASRVPGVKQASCVVMGKTAIVAIDVDSKLERSRVGTIKYSVAEALHKDPRGANAVVTADMDVHQRVAEMGQKIRQGHPVQGLTEELADMVGRIIPQMPNGMDKHKPADPYESRTGTNEPATRSEIKSLHQPDGQPSTPAKHQPDSMSRGNKPYSDTQTQKAQ